MADNWDNLEITARGTHIMASGDVVVNGVSYNVRLDCRMDEFGNYSAPVTGEHYSTLTMRRNDEKRWTVDASDSARKKVRATLNVQVAAWVEGNRDKIAQAHRLRRTEILEIAQASRLQCEQEIKRLNQFIDDLGHKTVYELNEISVQAYNSLRR